MFLTYFALTILQQATPEKSKGISGWGIFGLIILGLFILLAIIGYFTGVQRRLKSALAAKAAGNMAKAESLFRKVLDDENAEYVKNLTGDALTQHKMAAAQAHLEVGEIEQTKGDKSAAVSHYKKAAAAGFELSQRAVLFLAEAYAAEDDHSEAAIKVYLHYLQLRPQDKATAKVYSKLEAICRVEESQSADKRKAAVALNERVVNANPKVDWAHYYLGLAAFFDKNITKATEHFTKSQALNPDRQMTYYWLGACKLRGAKPDTKGATQSFDKFLSFQSEERKFLKRQARAAHELGMHLINAATGFGAKLSDRPAPQAETFKRGTDYLRTAVERDNSNAEYYFHLGQAYSDFGEAEVAIATFEGAVQLAANNAAYFFRLGTECVTAQRFDRAATALSEAVKLKGDDAEARALLADVCLHNADYVEAESQCRALLKLRKNIPGDLAMLVRALYHQSRYGEVVKEVEGAVEVKITTEVSADAVFCIGHSYLRDNQPAKALTWFESVPKEPRSLYNFACALTHAGLYDHAHTKLDELEPAPGDFAVRGHMLRANVWLRQGNLSAAEKYGRRAVDAAPLDATAHFTLGCVLYHAGKHELAREQFEAVLDHDPSHAAAMLGAALVHEHARSTAEAIEQYESIPESDPLAHVARWRLGILSCRQMEYARALAMLAGLEAPLAGNDAHLCYLATAQFQAGRFAESIQNFERVQEKHPQDQEIKVNIARARYMLGAECVSSEKYTEAAAEWERYLEVFPQDEKTRKDLGQVYFREAARRLRAATPEVYADVAPLLERAVKCDPPATAYSYLLALCYMKLGKSEEALARLKRLTEAADAKPLGKRLEYHVGLCHLQNGQAEEGLNVLKRVSRDVRPDAPGHGQFAAWAIANQKLRSGSVAEALEILAESL